MDIFMSLQDALYSYVTSSSPTTNMIWTLACSVHGVVAATRQIHMDYQVLWKKRDGTATFSRGEHLDPCLDRLLFLFWSHYSEDGPHLVCTGLLLLKLPHPELR